MIVSRDFDTRVLSYLNGDASAKEVVELRDTLRANPTLRPRFTALVRLHRAQAVVLAREQPFSFRGVLKNLHDFGNRAGRFLAHTCVLALVIVELDVTVPGIDTQSWIQPLVSVSEVSFETEEYLPVEVDSVSLDEDVAPMPDVREADFLES